MQCEEFLNLLNARADGELRAVDAAELDAHLVECAECRSAAEGLQAIDAELRRAFVPQREAATRLAESVAAVMRAGAGAGVTTVPEKCAAATYGLVADVAGRSGWISPRGLRVSTVATKPG